MTQARPRGGAHGPRGEVRTSASHPRDVGWLEPPARVGLTLAPGVRDRSVEGFRWERDLAADLDALVAAGVTVLVCLLEEPELARYGITNLVPAAQARGLEVLRLPIRDGDVPADLARVDELLATMAAREAAGGRLVIHCRGGLGRSGTIAGCHLVRGGLTPTAALAMLHRVRGPRCPENRRQEAFVAAYARRLRPDAPTGGSP
jgi:ADP-ribosyl-[dinitrogen reductase] hydrolase